MNTRIMLPWEFSEATFYDVRDINSTFAKGNLKVCYVGDNRNGSSFSKDVIRSALSSLRNVPIVCHWDYESNTIGAHDVELAKDENGRSFIRNLTEPCGVVPEHARFSFQLDTKDGKQYDTLIIEDVILWKRQDVYRHIMNDLGGKVAHSMEINVKDGKLDDRGIFQVTDFEFTALCLLESSKPCFENSELEVFEKNNFNLKFEEMIKEFEELKNMITTSIGDVNKKTQFIEKGGDSVLDKLALLAKYNLSVEDLNFSIEELSLEELEGELQKLGYSDDGEEGGGDLDDGEDSSEDNEDGPGEQDGQDEGEGNPEGTGNEGEQNEGSETGGEQGEGSGTGEGSGGQDPPQPEEDDGDDDTAALTKKTDYSLVNQVGEEIRRELSKVTYEAPWGTDNKYSICDFDLEKNEVYCFDCENWLLYGFSFEINGDAVNINYESKKRMKFSIVEFEDGSSAPIDDMFSERFSELENITHSNNELVKELTSLREFKQNVENSKAQEDKNELFKRFSDLEGIEAFEDLKANCSKYELEELEDKCFSIRGRNVSELKFSQSNPKQTKLVVDREARGGFTDDEPYNGIFVRRGIV